MPNANAVLGMPSGRKTARREKKRGEKKLGKKISKKKKNEKYESRAIDDVKDCGGAFVVTFQCEKQFHWKNR